MVFKKYIKKKNQINKNAKKRNTPSINPSNKIYFKSKQIKPKFQTTKIPTQIPNPPKQDYILQK